MNNPNQIMDRVQAAERMLRLARGEITRSHDEDATELLRATIRNVNHAIEGLAAPTDVITFSRTGQREAK